MCGFAGILRRGAHPLPDPSVLRRMVGTIEHRGPDESGEYLSDDVQLGVVRLSIIDVKEGHQPVWGCDAGVVGVYNGELYNHYDLRRELQQDRHRLQNDSDSAVLPHAYELWGSDFVRHLRGMFALAIWDVRERRLLLARDRLGIKPLYVAETPHYVLFASEIKALLASGLVPRAIDRDALDDLLSLSYPCPPRTMFAGIRELRPAHWIEARAGDGRGLREPHRYWRAPFVPRGEHRRISRRDAEAELRELLRRKVYEHLQSDVPVATYLSGGLDSSALSALVKEVTGDPPTAFSIGFESMEHDELPFANRMAAALGSRQHTVVCDRATADAYPHVLWHMELPLQFPLALPLERLSASARGQGFKVVLTGEGADELFGGYDCFRADKMRRIFDRPLLRPLRPAVYRRLYGWHGLPDGTVDKMLANQGRSDEIKRRFGGVYPAWFDMWTTLDLDRARLLSPDGRTARPADEPPEGFLDLLPEDVDTLHPFDAVLALELESRLPSWILQIGDRASMANGVEARVPFLDHEVVEYAASLSPALKMQGFTEKALLRGAVSDLLPPEIARRQKRPFYTPLKSWFFAEGGPAYVPEVLSERAVRDAGLFDPQIVTRLRRSLHEVPDDHLLRVQHEWVLTLILGTQLMHELFIAGRGGPPAAEGPWS